MVSENKYDRWRCVQRALGGAKIVERIQSANGCDRLHISVLNLKLGNDFLQHIDICSLLAMNLMWTFILKVYNQVYQSLFCLRCLNL